MSLNNEQREIFKSVILKFKNHIDKIFQNNDKLARIKATEEDKLIEKELEENLDNLFSKLFIDDKNYVTRVSFYTFKHNELFKDFPVNVSFFRKDILGNEFVNELEAPTQSKGVFICLSYNHTDVLKFKNKNKYFKLHFDFPKGNIKAARCPAVNKMEEDGILKDKHCYEYENIESEFDRLIDDLLEMMKYFNSFPQEEFRKDSGSIKSDIQKQNDDKKPTDNSPIPLNQILYGPPGTGKTYHTINKALEILKEYGEIDEIPSDNDREEQKAQFDKFKDNGQIKFVTFHQSYGYEEFVEGIRPNLQNTESISYEIHDGIFKEICQKALKNYQNSQKNQERLKQDVEIEKLIEEYAEFIQQQLNEGQELDFTGTKLTKSVMKMIEPLRKNGLVQSFRIKSSASTDPQSLTRDIIFKYYESFKRGELRDWKDIKPSYESQAKYHGNALYYFTLFEKLKDYEDKHLQPESLDSEIKNIKLKPYILIIDEINRGNISKILGELITLIEPSKRIGADEELRVELPYSADNEEDFFYEKGFGVPKNLYIIGTMNTADRSIALLDTALRRRFDFIEMMPKPKLLKDRLNDVDLVKLLESINNRIEFLLDREHTIGHSYFIKVQNLNDLREVFKNRIIPLLQEYFYDDYAKIIAVLNGNGMIESKNMNDLNVNLNDDLVDSEKVIYRITDSKDWREWQFKKIYNNDAKKPSEEE